MRLISYAFILLIGMALPLSAQDDNDDSSMLGDFLQDTLSADSRFIKVSGLSGAFSSQATIKKITVADNDGIWLTVIDAELDWNRLALLKGRFSVNTLSAKEIIITRPPGVADTETEIPKAEATPFAVPEIPVAIELGKLQIDRIELGKDVVGIAAVLEVTGALKLADGALDTRLEINRLDRDGDAAALIAAFDNQTRQLALDLSLTEGANGLMSNALQIPDRPSLQLTAKGDGPINAFTADIALASDGTPRLTGQVTVHRAAASDENSQLATVFGADLSGDVRALVTAEYQPFFGSDTGLHLQGRLDPDGRLDLDAFRINSNSLALTGKLAIQAAGDVDFVTLQGSVAPPIGTEVVLPMTGPRTAIRGASISLFYDQSVGKGWRLTLEMNGLNRPDMTLSKAQIQASGTVLDTGLRNIQGTVSAALDDLVLSDDNLHQAIGPKITLNGDFVLEGADALHLKGFVLQGGDYSALVDGTVNGLNSGFSLDGTARIKSADLSRFAGVAGRPVAGAINAQVNGTGSVLSGQFDFKLDALAQDLVSGTKEADALMSGATTLAVDIARDETGITIRKFDLTGTALKASATGTASGEIASLHFSAGLDDLGRIIKEAPGPIDLKGTMDRNGPLWSGTVRVDGAHNSHADLTGSYHTEGTVDFSYDALMTRIERFVPDFSGELSSSGKAQRSKDGVWSVDSTAKGPAGITAQVTGNFDETSGLADLAAKGQLQLGIANRFISPTSVSGLASFDMALKGRPELDAVSGTVTTSGVTVALPQIVNAITDLGGTASLSRGQVQLALAGGLRTGGTFTVNGPVTVTPPFPGTLTVQLQQIVLTDNVSYESSANGQLVYSGPLAGNGKLSGQIEFGETEINIAASGGAANAAPIPDMQHLGESGAVRSTRARAGLIKTEKSGTGPVIGLDISLIANNKIFVRGRGLQAELGGGFRIRGTTAKVEPAGQISLIRGNLDIFGRRLNLTKGLVSLQGQLEPYIEFAATTTTSDGTATLEIAGPLTNPEVNVVTDPDRPAEEGLAMLIFGNQFSELSPLKIAQLASSLAQLRGGGGGTQGKIRDSLGVDTFDLTQDEDGNAQVGAGAYVADNVYTDISVNTKGETELNINLDVSNNLTVKGSVDSSGSSGLGLFFERDY